MNIIPGMLIQVKPYKYMTAYYKLITPEEYTRAIQTGGVKDITFAIEPGMICLVLEKVNYKFGGGDTLKLLIGDRICYIHDSLYNEVNFQIVRSEAA